MSAVSPTLQNQQSSGIKEESVRKVNATAKSILIADDSATIRRLIRTLLQWQTGCEICGEAVDGVDAIEKAKRLKPDLILLDLSMPRMNGAEAASILKDQMPGVRIILFTMYSEWFGDTLASALGVDIVLSKPDGMGKLVESVDGLLGS
jgi:DNA-binding NarL/FixJ family response regulator